MVIFSQVSNVLEDLETLVENSVLSKTTERKSRTHNLTVKVPMK